MQKTIIIGTRGSKLALCQANMLMQRLQHAFPHACFEIKVIKTKGDLILDKPLAQIGGKGLFTKEIEDSLLDGRIDMAVHSLKDLPTTLPDEIVLGAVLSREDMRDVFISKDGRSLSDFGAGDLIATSSLRRKAQLLHYNPTLQVADIRGNVETRINKMLSGTCAALVLAAAGVIRLGKQDCITEYFPPEVMLPAVCQGIIGVEVRENDKRIERLVTTIDHQETRFIADAERTFLHTLEGGCQIPVGCYSYIEKDQYYIKACLSDVDGKKMVRGERSGSLKEASSLAVSLALELKGDGGIIHQLRDHYV